MEEGEKKSARLHLAKLKKKVGEIKTANTFNKPALAEAAFLELVGLLELIVEAMEPAQPGEGVDHG